MGIVARWIDTLGPAERDAIITHPDPTFMGDRWWASSRDCGCLVGTVCVARFGEYNYNPLLLGYQRLLPYMESHRWDAVGQRFPELTYRFTPERMWRLVKARAARNHRLPLTTASVSSATQYEEAVRT